MRIEERRYDVVAHHKQAKPRGQRSAAKQREMSQPHREKDNRAEKADLDRYRQNLIMRVGGDEGRNRPNGSVTLEQLWNRPRSMADDGRLGDEGERLLPVFKAQPGRGIDVPGLVDPQLLDRNRDTFAQIR
jgi:hypothetical protein